MTRVRWTPQELNFLKVNAERFTIAQLAGLIGKPKASIRHQCWRLSIKAKRPPTTWTEKEIQFLHDNKDKLTIMELSQELRRSYSATKTKCRALGIRTLRKYFWDGKVGAKLTPLPNTAPKEDHNQDRAEEVDALCEHIEETFCSRCACESNLKACQILSRAYKGRLPRQWNLKIKSCYSFQQRGDIQ